MLAKQVSFGIFNGLLPTRDGAYTSPLAMPVTLTFSASIQEQTIDFLKEYQGADIEFIQSVYIDNADGADYFHLTVPVTLYRIVCPPNRQGWFPILLPKNVPLIAALANALEGENEFEMTMIFANVPMPAATW